MPNADETSQEAPSPIPVPRSSFLHGTTPMMSKCSGIQISCTSRSLLP